MQADGRLAGAGGALYAHGRGEVPADEVVLLGLDGRGDVPHGADTGVFDLARENAALRKPGAFMPLIPATVLVPVGVLIPVAVPIGSAPPTRSSSRPVRSAESPLLPGAAA